MREIPYYNLDMIIFVGYSMDDIDIIETFGRGVQLMKEECEANQLPQSKYEPFADGFRIVFQRPEFARGNDSKDDSKNLTLKQQSIISLIERNPNISIPMIAETLHVSPITIQRAIDKMPNVVHVGPKNGGHWEIVR